MELLKLIGPGSGQALAGCDCLRPAEDLLAFAGIDSSLRRLYGHARRGAAFGQTKIQGMTVLVRG